MLNRAKVVICVLIVLTVVHVSIRLVLRTFQKPLEPVQFYDQFVQNRIENQLNKISDKSPKELLDMLVKMEYYDWPGCFIGSGQISSLADESRYQKNVYALDIVLSSRVFRKSYHELSQMSKGEVTSIVIDEMKRTLSDYCGEYDSFIKDCNKDVSRALIFQISDAPNGKPTLLGLKYKIFALILISESLGLTECHTTIVDIAKLAIRQKTEIQKFNDPLVVFALLTNMSLCNSHILSAGLYGTCPNKTIPELAYFLPRYVKRDLVSYSAQSTEYDVLVRDGFLTRDTDKGFMSIYLFEKATDEDIQTLIKF